MEGVSSQLKSLVKDIREDEKDILKDLGSRYFQCSLEELTELTLASAGPLKMLVKLTKDFAQRFSDKKREKNVLDFSDMEHFALEILLKKKEISVRQARQQGNFPRNTMRFFWMNIRTATWFRKS